ncbi:DUF2279 domain-containing protein [Pseudochryseolinea flava]|uniref:DUF2279 domain-containing protein n=2 Tax=Pseudochryseolinea flava TaxID=2059302 RepID=A0A364XY27_9BACT|nr:DUF2279 domain-containing protein [Pseudochryseolinea flava]
MTMAAASKSFILSLILFSSFALTAQPVDTASHVNKKRLKRLVWTSSAAYGVTLVGLHQLWYKNAEQQSFQFFNDNPEWKQVDKLGHFFSTFYFSYGTAKALKWCNVPDRKADLAGALTGFTVMIPIEIMDGFSDAYGASTGDLLANASGSLLYFGQSRLWNEIRIYPKYSFRPTDFARERPNVLGDGFFSEALKDYNGQTYWLSIDVDKFTKFPKWLNIAVGYGAEGMVYARDQQNIEQGFGDPYRQYYLGIDFDLTAIHTRSKFLKTVLFLVNMLKLPSPAVEYSKGNFRFRPLAF